VAFEKGRSGNPAGKLKGTLNKTTRAAKEAIAAAADELGGTERLVAWVREDPANERLFWGSIYTKLLSASGTQDDPVHNEHNVAGLAPIYGLQPPAQA